MGIDRHRLLLRSLLPLLLTLTASGLSAQQLDSKGTEFWAAFMSNLGSMQQQSEMRFYVSCDRPTTARVTYTGTGFTATIPIPIANRPVEVDVNAIFGSFVELENVTWMGSPEEMTRKSFRITADDEITLIGLNLRNMSSDAWLGLPVDVLSGRYIVQAYPNGLSGPGGGGTYDTPSQFCIVATEDSTIVRITPAAGVSINGRDVAPFTVLMAKGDVFFGQADLFGEKDVSGTEILTDRRIAVFGGNRRTSVPTRVGNYRDHLVEQMPPLEAWGRNAIVTPHFNVTPLSTDTAVYRILSAFGANSITVTDATGTRNFMLGRGESIELPLLRASSVTASGPILVAQYEHSVGQIPGMGTLEGIGDPFMMLIPAVEQFDSSYSFQSIVHEQFPDTAAFINIVVPAAASGTLLLDGLPISPAWEPVPGGDYVFAQHRVLPGAHFIRAAAPFGLFVYGYGPAVSYGYPGGTLFKDLVVDFEPPDLAATLLCGEYTGFAFDSRISDSGIDSCYALPDARNVLVEIEPFVSGVDTVRFRVQLIDPYQDGKVSIKAIDSSGLSILQTKIIPGFTVGVGGAVTMPAPLDTTFVVNTPPQVCRSVRLTNYGGFEQTITSARVVEMHPNVTITTPLPITIPPGGGADIELCFTDLGDSTITATLQVGGDCADRLLALVPVQNFLDTAGPGIGREGPPCSDEVYVAYTKPFRASPISSVGVDTAINCVVESVVSLPASVARMRLRRIDPRYDMIYQFTVADSVGNIVVDRDTIGGFTVAAIDRNRDTVSVRIDRPWAGDSLRTVAWRCDSLTVVNYGSRRLDLAGVRLRTSRNYSIPPSQFPISIPAGEERRIVFCIEGGAALELLDTVALVDACQHEELVALKTPLSTPLSEAMGPCRARMTVTTFAPAKRTFLTPPVPNPVHDGAYVDIGLTRDEQVSLELYDAQGLHRVDVVDAHALPAGITRLAFDISELPSGAYYCVLTTGSGERRSTSLIISH